MRPASDEKGALSGHPVMVGWVCYARSRCSTLARDDVEEVRVQAIIGGQLRME